MKRTASFLQILKSETGTALFLCLLVTPVVAVTNITASLSLILVHATVLAGSVSICSAILIWRVPRPSTYRLGYDIALRIVAIAVSTAGALPVISFISEIPINQLLGRPLLAAMIPVVAGYTILSLIRALYKERQQALLIQNAQIHAAWQALTAQIRPHFLFNCLNGLEQLVATEPNRAEENIRKLAAMYRAVLDASEQQLVPLNNELKLVADYLQLQQMRYGNRLHYHLHVSPETVGVRFPATLLLSMVENAVKHGIEKLGRGGQITVRISIHGDQLIASVDNPVPGPVAASDEPGKYGIKDIEQRLSLLFDESASFRLQIENLTANATIQMPLKRLAPSP